MTVEGYSNFVTAESEDVAIARAIADLERRGMMPDPTPLYVEDQGDGTIEVVLRERRRRHDHPDEGVFDVYGPGWRSPLTDYVAVGHTVGSARLRRDRYTTGYYHMEGTGGHEYFHVWGGHLPLTILERSEDDHWSQWMIDDPLHWYGMKEAVDALPDGDIVVAGLGLGLFAHHMATDPRFGRITVVELSQDVVDLVSPTLPADPRRTVVVGDFYRYLTVDADPATTGILWDLAVGSREETYRDFLYAKVMADIALPGVPIVCFGERRRPRP